MRKAPGRGGIRSMRTKLYKNKNRAKRKKKKKSEKRLKPAITKQGNSMGSYIKIRNAFPIPFALR